MRTWTLLLLVIATATPAQEPSLGVFDGHSDVGRTRNPGSVVYDAVHDVYTIAGSGANMWPTTTTFISSGSGSGETSSSRRGRSSAVPGSSRIASWAGRYAPPSRPARPTSRPR